jgi:SAM-dependent methyltransferase
MHFLRKYLVGLDVYERHNIVSEILTKSGSKSVIDVGGTAGMLQMFSRSFEVIAINVDDSGDVTYAGKELPYADNSFDAVVSLDTLEHIPREGRKGFVEEILRVAKRDVVFCTPLGTELHRSIEIEINEAWRRDFNEDHRFLKEHIDYGLPTMGDVKDMLSGQNYELFFVGDVRLAACLFRNYVRALKQRNSLVKRFYEYLGLSSTLLFHFLRVTNGPSEFTNRVYAHVRKASVKQEARN